MNTFMKPRKGVILRFIASAAATVLSLFAILYSGVISLSAAAVLAIVLAGLYAAVWFRPNPKVLYGIAAVTMAYLCECVMQIQIEHRFALLFSYQRIIDYALYLLVFLILITALRRKSSGLILGTIFFYGISTLNLAVTVFRGKPVYFPDIYSAGTAMAVAGEYSFPISKVHIVSTILMASCVLLLTILRERQDDKNAALGKRMLRVCAMLMIPAALVLFRIPTVLQLRGYYFSTTEYWLYSFSMSAYQMRVLTPSGYESDRVPENVEQQRIQHLSDERPNVVFIMNEAFSDLRMISSFEGEDSVMPFFDELAAKDTAARGTLHTSIYGGNTANTEFEVLTGVSMYHLPFDTTAYNLYLNRPTHSLADYFSSLGYQTAAFHPSAATNYNRIRVYPNLGFGKSLFQEDFSDLETLRTFTSDVSNYEIIIEMLDQKESGKPLFLFNVTVQNHGPFDIQDDAFENKVTLPDPNQKEAAQFFSCIKYSDEALEEFVSYVESYPEPVVLVFFGDHQPKINDTFYDMLFGKSPVELSEEENLNRFMVPYLIWTNYGLPLEDGVEMSANYLGAYVVEQLGLPQTQYQCFLNTLRESYPVITVHGVRDAETDPDSSGMLGTYEQLSYNLLFDKKHIWEDVYSLQAP